MGLNLMATFGLDGAGFEKGLHGLRQQTAGFTRELQTMVMAGIGIGSLGAAFAKTIERANDLYRLSIRTNLSFGDLQVFERAAQNAGSSFDIVTLAIDRLNASRQKAIAHKAGWKNIVEGFKVMGLTEADLASKSQMGQLLVDKVAPLVRSKGETEGLTLAFREAGIRASGELVSIMRQDFDAIAKDMKYAMMTTDQVATLHQFSVEMKTLGLSIMPAFANAIISFISQIQKAMSAYLGWIDSAMGIKKPGDETKKTGVFSTIGNTLGGIGSGFASLGLEAAYRLTLNSALFKELSEDAMMASQNHFGKAGLVGGMLSDIADAMVKHPEGLQASFEAKWAEILKQIEVSKNLMGKGGEGFENENYAPKMGHSSKGDSMIRVGNFLGAAGNPVMSLMKQQVDILHVIARNTSVTKDSWGFIGNKRITAGHYENSVLYGPHHWVWGNEQEDKPNMSTLSVPK